MISLVINQRQTSVGNPINEAKNKVYTINQNLSKHFYFLAHFFQRCDNSILKKHIFLSKKLIILHLNNEISQNIPCSTKGPEHLQIIQNSILFKLLIKMTQLELHEEDKF